MPGELQREAVEVLQRLLRIDTSNPPGNERPAQEYLASLLEPAGFEVDLVGPDPERPNLTARLRGQLKLVAERMMPAFAGVAA